MNITITHAPGETLAFAAGELRGYLARMLPADAAMSVQLVTVPVSGNDAFSVDLSPAGGSIAGSSDRAVLLGAYDALRTLGCRFLAPGQEYEFVPPVAPQAIDAMPKMAVTIGIKQILAARKVRLGVFRDWHRAVVRQAAYGPVTAHFPASLLQDHPDAAIYANATASGRPF